MALATQCPHCGTTFRVAQDQLKLRAGLVRCGACKQIFNGVEHLLRPARTEQPTLVVMPAAPHSSSDPTSDARDSDSIQQGASDAVNAPLAPEVRPEAKDELATDGSFDQSPSLASDTSPMPVPTGPVMATPDQFDAPARTQEDPLQRMTLMDFSDPDEEANPEAFGDTRIAHRSADFASEAVDQNESAMAVPDDSQDELSRAIDDLQSKPWQAQSQRGWHGQPKKTEGDDAEPGFVRRARRQQRLGRPLRLLIVATTFILLLGALLQGTYVFRDQIAARLPQTLPALTQFCQLLDCQVGLPMQIDAVSIESSELQSLAPAQNSFALIALLRNRSATVQAWPHIELTLNDANEKAVVRRIFSPRDYLPPGQDANKGLPADSEQAAKVAFELSELKASGYRVYLFYP